MFQRIVCNPVARCIKWPISRQQAPLLGQGVAVKSAGRHPVLPNTALVLPLDARVCVLHLDDPPRWKVENDQTRADGLRARPLGYGIQHAKRWGLLRCRRLQSSPNRAIALGGVMLIEYREAVEQVL